MSANKGAVGRSSKISVRIVLDQDDNEICIITKADKTAYVPKVHLAAATQPPTVLAQELARQGITILSSRDRSDVIGRIDEAAVSDESIILAKHCGWITPTTYVFADGTAYTAGTIDPSVAVFFERQKKFSTSGSLSGWKQGMQQLLDGQPTMQAIMCFALLPPILRWASQGGVEGNIGLQLTGPTSTGKTTALRVAGSAWGGLDDYGGDYLETWLSTENSFETLMHNHADALLVIDEANMAGTSRRTRAAKQSAAVFMLASGRGKARYDVGGDARFTRLVTLSSSNEPLTLSNPQEGAVGPALDVRMPTIDLSGRPYGVLDGPGADGAATIIDRLNNLAREHYGYAAREFVRWLTSQIAHNEASFSKRIRDLVAEFRRHAKYDDLAPPQQRVCNSFALASAAGCLARRHGLLPASWNTLGRSVLQLFHIAVGGHAQRLEATVLGFEASLNALRNSIRWVPRNSAISPPQTSAPVGYVKHSNQGCLELLVPPNQFTTHFEKIANLLPTLEEVGAWRRDGAHLTTKRRLYGSGTINRFYVVQLGQDSRFGKLRVLRAGKRRRFPAQQSGPPEHLRAAVQAAPSILTRRPAPRPRTPAT